MKVIGLTGGIGSGKTTVAHMFKALGIPIYIADEEAKRLISKSKIIRKKLIALFGQETYLKNNQINKTFIAEKIFNNPENLKKMNAIVHPKVAQHFGKWVKKQTAPYVLKESAILFETGANTECHKVIVVTTPEETRIKRVLKRDETTREKIEAVIKNQLPEEDKIKQGDFVIHNNTIEETQNQVEEIHKQLLKMDF